MKLEKAISITFFTIIVAIAAIYNIPYTGDKLYIQKNKVLKIESDAIFNEIRYEDGATLFINKNIDLKTLQLIAEPNALGQGRLNIIVHKSCNFNMTSDVIEGNLLFKTDTLPKAQVILKFNKLNGSVQCNYENINLNIQQQ